MLLGAWLNCTWRQQQQWKFTVQQLLFTPKLKNLKLWSHQTTNHLGLVWATILTCHRKQTLTLTSELLKQTHMQQEWCQQVVSLQLVDRRCWGWMGRRDVCQICRILTLKYWFCDERIWLCRLRAAKCCNNPAQRAETCRLQRWNQEKRCSFSAFRHVFLQFTTEGGVTFLS